MVIIKVDGREIEAAADTTVAAALLSAGVHTFRSSVTGEARAPVCGMGICFECRVTLNGVPHRRACLEVVQDGMEIETGA
jgi:sarcosine oxidase subunit alpha